MPQSFFVISAAGGAQGADGGRDGEGVDASAFFPQVPGLVRNAVDVAVGENPVGGFNYQRDVEALDELDVAESFEVFAKSPQNQAGFVLLNGQDALAFDHPGVPTACEFGGGRVLVQEVAVAIEALGAEAEEAAREFALACQDERIGDERAVARPAV